MDENLSPPSSSVMIDCWELCTRPSSLYSIVSIYSRVSLHLCCYGGYVVNFVNCKAFQSYKIITCKQICLLKQKPRVVLDSNPKFPKKYLGGAWPMYCLAFMSADAHPFWLVNWFFFSCTISFVFSKKFNEAQAVRSSRAKHWTNVRHFFPW